MKCYELHSTKGPDGLQVAERPIPRAGARQVVVRVRAASLNYRDLMIAGGNYARPVRLPLVPLSDGAGEVVEVGSEVKRVSAGDRVAAIFFQRWLAGPVPGDIQDAALGGTVDGMLAEYVALDAEGVVQIPPHLSWEEAATLPCAAVTAWHGLVEAGQLRAGQAALLLGTGGVSVFGMQFARLAGARALIISSSDEKLERARGLGASETINYRQTAEWQDRVRELTQGQGVDQALDVVGGETLRRALLALRIGGHIALIGARSGQGLDLERRQIMAKAARITGINVGSRAMFEAMNRAIAAGGLKPAIHRVYPFAEAVQAYRDFAAAQHFGKVVIAI